jgi:hypothetical protein
MACAVAMSSGSSHTSGDSSSLNCSSRLREFRMLGLLTNAVQATIEQLRTSPAPLLKGNVSKYLEKKEALTDPESETPRRHVGDEGNQREPAAIVSPVSFGAGVVPSTQEPAAIIDASKCLSALRP